MFDVEQKDVANEESIVWLENPERFDYVRQTVEYKATRQRGIGRRTWNGNRNQWAVGYATLRADAPSHDPGRFRRRVFWVTPWDRSEQPDGKYRTGAPGEAVDPRTVKPGKVGRMTRRAWNCDGFEGRPHGGRDGCSLCGAEGTGPVEYEAGEDDF